MTLDSRGHATTLHEHLHNHCICLLSYSCLFFVVADGITRLFFTTDSHSRSFDFRSLSSLLLCISRVPSVSVSPTSTDTKINCAAIDPINIVKQVSPLSLFYMLPFYERKAPQ